MWCIGYTLNARPRTAVLAWPLVFPASQIILTMTRHLPLAAFAKVRFQRPAGACALVAPIAMRSIDRRINAPLDPARFPA